MRHAFLCFALAATCSLFGAGSCGVSRGSLKRVLVVGLTAERVPEMLIHFEGQLGPGIQLESGLPDVNAELVLFAVDYRDGPMPPLREALDRLEGREITRAAILLSGVGTIDDPELRDLVRMEATEMMATCGLHGLDILEIPGPSAGRLNAMISEAPHPHVVRRERR
jgi:hypothetical protein